MFIKAGCKGTVVKGTLCKKVYVDEVLLGEEGGVFHCVLSSKCGHNHRSLYHASLLVRPPVAVFRQTARKIIKVARTKPKLVARQSVHVAFSQ